MLLRVIEMMQIKALHLVDSVELARASQRWVAYIDEHPFLTLRRSTAYTFTSIATDWLVLCVSWRYSA
jgi:hypothetical protein